MISIEVERKLTDAVVIARLRGVERRRRGGHRRGRPLRRRGRRTCWPRSTPRTTTTSRSTGRTSASTPRATRAQLAHDELLARDGRHLGPRRRLDHRHRAQPALEVVLHRAARLRHRGRRDDIRDPRCPAGRRSAHPAGPDHRHLVRPGARRAVRLEPSRYTGPTGIVGVIQEASHRRASTLSTGPRCRTTSHSRRAQGDDGAARAARGPDRYADRPARPARGRPGLGARRRRAGVRGRDVADYVRSLEEEQDTVDLPEATGDAIAREFERYLKRRNDE